MASVCDEIREALRGFETCATTDEGAEVATHCMYPSFEPVRVYVARFGDGFLVHDAGGAERSIWSHGRDEDGAHQLAVEARRFGVQYEKGLIKTEAFDQDWLASAILAVANASSNAARVVVEKAVARAEGHLKDRIFEALQRVVKKDRISKGFEKAGLSGKLHRYDFEVHDRGRQILLNAVTPHPASVTFSYVDFADIEDSAILSRFAVVDAELTPDDTSLLLQVSEIVPLKSLEVGARRALALKA